ncbi:Endonuclease/exonuclease/phosphatase, partial [Mycena filopes]
MLTLVQINSWKSRHPLEVLTVEDFDIICVQEPNHNEVVNARENSEYVHIYPDAYDNHRVSVFIKLASIPAANICPRPDLSKSGDILVIEFTFDTHKVTLINLYNDCNTRAGVGLLRFVLLRLDPLSQIFLVLDSNSHHPSWDLLTKTPTCEEDFELHDLLVSRGLLLVTPPDVPTHISGNVIDLGFCSPSLFMAVSATVDPSLCVGSDHLPIHYSLNFDVTVSKSIKFNSEKMDLDVFLGVLSTGLGCRPLPVITTLEELDDAAEFLNAVILAAMEESTPRHRPSSKAKRWWN